MGESTPGLDQYAIKKFGEALEIVPKVLAENAGRKPTEVVSSLYAAHATGQVHTGVNIEVCILNRHSHSLLPGLNINAAQHEESESVIDAQKAGILDNLKTKTSALRLGADAAITVLRVDQVRPLCVGVCV